MFACVCGNIIDDIRNWFSFVCIVGGLAIEVNDSVSGIVGLHYNEQINGWEKIEDAEIVNGYAYGTVESLSPIAVFTVKKDIEVKEDYLWKGLIAVYGNGNPIRVYTNENNEGVIENKLTGKSYTLTSTETVLFGGTSDGTPLNKTSIAVEAGEYPKLDIKAGSQSPTIQTSVGTINLVINDAKVGSVSGSSGCVHTDLINFTINNSEFSWLGTGESITYLKSGNVDANKGYTPETVNTLKAPFWTKKVVLNLNNVKTELLYSSANTGMTFTKEVIVNINGGEIDYILLCASNGYTESVTGTISNVTGNIFQTNNRGIVNNVKAEIKDSVIPNLFVAGDNTDKTVNGVTNKVAIDIGKGTYTLIPGTQNGVEMTSDVAAKTVDKIKYSRSANITFADNTKDVLDGKLIMK